jgi:lipopolysaccharide transport system permease protein
LTLLLLIGHEFTRALLLTPLVILPLYIAIVGICLMIASASVYLRDLAQVMPFATTAMLFMSPVFYTIEAIPPPYHQIVQLNFLTIPIEFLRQLIITGSVIDLPLLGIYTALSFTAYFLGRYIFKRLSYGFTDVL